MPSLTLSDVHVLVLHVKQGYEDRDLHMTKMLNDLNIEFEYILDGDIPDLSDERLQTFFSGDIMCSKTAHASCAMKHILAYKTIIDRGYKYTLILEDDMFLRKDFVSYFEKSLSELSQVSVPALVSYEATCLLLVPRTQRRKGQINYAADSLQCLGSYLVNLQFAQAVYQTVSAEKCDRAVDWYIDLLRERGVFKLYWSYPVLAEQGSHNGRMMSAIDVGGHAKSWIMRVKRKLTFKYKQLIYFFR